MWLTSPEPSAASDRARVLLRPNAVVHAKIPWHTTWMDLDEQCNPIRRPLPRGRYTLVIPNPAYPLDGDHGAPPSLERIGEVR
jgi:hypothetical protein